MALTRLRQEQLVEQLRWWTSHAAHLVRVKVGLRARVRVRVRFVRLGLG